MLTSKQRARLRAYANKMDTILQIGKDGIAETSIRQVDDALTAREMIKIRVLETAPLSAREAAEELADETESDVVQVIGTRVVLYRRGKKGEYDDCL